MVVRQSGTEPMVRVMIEGEDRARITGLAAEVAAAVESATLST